MVKYKHTQIGYAPIAILLFLITILWAPVLLDAYSGYHIFAFIVTGLLFICFLLLGTLTVEVDEKFLRICLGIGIVRRKFLLHDIVSVKKVKNHWLCGWGIRIWFWPYMIIYNVSGYDAIELKMKNNRIYRVGTDDPESLLKAIDK